MLFFQIKNDTFSRIKIKFQLINTMAEQLQLSIVSNKHHWPTLFWFKKNLKRQSVKVGISIIAFRKIAKKVAKGKAAQSSHVQYVKWAPFGIKSESGPKEHEKSELLPIFPTFSPTSRIFLNLRRFSPEFYCIFNFIGTVVFQAEGFFSLYERSKKKFLEQTL